MRLRLLLSAALLALLSSCSTSFEREWKQALKNGAQTGVEGAWAGTWRSETTGHHGKLRCVVRPQAGDVHDFHYHATWMGILSGAYRAPHQVTPLSRGYTFKGQHKMPDWAGGLYSYEGTIKGDDFHAAYRCAKDQGAYSLRRVR
jgi:hypothetical protein